MRLEKPYTNKQYADLAVYCNANGLIIEDKGDHLESVLPPEPSVAEKQTQVRAVRNQYLTDTDKYMIEDFPIMDEEREEYKAYRTYLRDFTEMEEWWTEMPLTFDEWKQVVIESSNEGGD